MLKKNLVKLFLDGKIGADKMGHNQLAEMFAKGELKDLKPDERNKVLMHILDGPAGETRLAHVRIDEMLKKGELDNLPEGYKAKAEEIVGKAKVHAEDSKTFSKRCPWLKETFEGAKSHLTKGDVKGFLSKYGQLEPMSWDMMSSNRRRSWEISDYGGFAKGLATCAFFERNFMQKRPKVVRDIVDLTFEYIDGRIRYGSGIKNIAPEEVNSLRLIMKSLAEMKPEIAKFGKQELPPRTRVVRVGAYKLTQTDERKVPRVHMGRFDTLLTVLGNVLGY